MISPTFSGSSSDDDDTLMPGVNSADHHKRIFLTATIGLASAAVVLAQSQQRPMPSDFAQIWAAARGLLGGSNPYDIVGPGRPFEWDFPLLYPMPAVVVGVPFALLPLRVAEILFVGLSAAALTWVLTRERVTNPQLLGFTSLAFYISVGTVQWAPLMCAAVLAPSLGFLLACKPTLGLALIAAYPSRRAILGATLFAGATVVLWPWWVREWLAALPAATHVVAPVTQWGGPLMLLAAFRWRRPDARLLLTLACVPHTPMLYEAVPLVLVVRTVREGVALSVLTALVFIAVYLQDPPYDQWTEVSGQWMLLLLYLPALMMVLRRPNVAQDVKTMEGFPRTALENRLAAWAKRPRATDAMAR